MPLLTFIERSLCGSRRGRSARSGWPHLRRSDNGHPETVAAPLAPLVLLGLHQLHYWQRTLVYPALMRSTGKRMPLAVAAMGFSFNALNGWLIGRWLSALGAYYLGEILEWVGWALASWSLPGLAFALFTIANLAPRALANHRWYRATFPDYPASRRALVPWVW